MRIRVTWHREHHEVHPELGLLTPGASVVVDVPAEIAAGYAADTSGAWTVEVLAAPTEEREG